MIKVLLVDDEPASAESIQIILERNFSHIHITGAASSAQEAIEMIKKHDPDVVFLDIEMPYANGFALLDMIPSRRFEVIFVTAYNQYAINAFKVNAVDYILKPFTEDDILSAFGKAEVKMKEKAMLLINTLDRHNSQQKTNMLALPTSDGLEFLHTDDVIRCEAAENYTWFHLSNKSKILVSRNLQEYEELLEPNNFHRIHHAHLVNLVHVKKYIKGRGGYVVMSDGSHIDVSVRKKAEFFEKLHL